MVLPVLDSYHPCLPNSVMRLFKISRWVKLCCVAAWVLVLANEIVKFSRLKRERGYIFNSNYEMVLVLALIVVMLFAIVYKSRQNRGSAKNGNRDLNSWR